ncbi:hypothetical protein [Comamonas composti]|uniref:hypothetical protein n=1 Tax=Comamonas composti TaxID=408558 RepID=UPI0012EBACE4|nr:hypothetical protein [Comamonas composti]
MKYRKRYLIIFAFVIWMIAAICAMYLPLNMAHQINEYNPIPFVWKKISGWRGFVKSDFEEISSIYYSIIWFDFPIFFILIWSWLKRNLAIEAGGLLAKKKLNILDKIIIIFYIPLFSLIIYGVIIGNEGQGLRYFDLGKSKFDLAFFGIIAPLAAAIGSAFIFFGIFRIFNLEDKHE